MARRARSRDEARGSVLAVSLLVLVLLSALAGAALLLALQERRLAAARRDRVQASFAARSLAALARTWLDDPSPRNPFLPGPGDWSGDHRDGETFSPGELGRTEASAAAGHAYRGGPCGGQRVPFVRSDDDDPEGTFWGRRDGPDVLLVAEDGEPGAAHLARLSSLLYVDDSLVADGHDRQPGTAFAFDEVRLHAPPLDRRTRERVGRATLEVRASKVLDGGRRVVARRRVVQVLGDIPWPRTTSAASSPACVSPEEVPRVRWGALECSGADPLVLPARSGERVTAVPRRDASRSGFHAGLNTAGLGSPDGVAQALLPWLLGATRPDGARVVLEDPWVRHVASGPVLREGDEAAWGSAQPWPWRPDADLHLSHAFQLQAPLDRAAAWAAFEQATRAGLRGLRHFAGRGGDLFVEGGRGEARPWSAWADRMESEAAAFWFAVPRAEGGAAEDAAAPRLAWPAGLEVEGVIYLEAASLDVSQAGTAAVREATPPGEPFLDHGIDLGGLDGEPADGCICIAVDGEGSCLRGVRPQRVPGDGPGPPCTDDLLALASSTEAARATASREAFTFGNGRWDADADGDGRADQKAWESPDAAAAIGHGPGAAAAPHPGEDPRFPAPGRAAHEPFLNLRLAVGPADAGDGGAASGRFVADFAAEGERVAAAEPGSCAATTTTRGRDPRGPALPVPVHLRGLLRVTGSITGPASLAVHGAVEAGVRYDHGGLPEVWFDEGLADGTFPPEEYRLPQVMVLSTEESWP